MSFTFLHAHADEPTIDVPAIGLSLPLGDIADAHEEQERGVLGKVLIDLLPG